MTTVYEDDKVQIQVDEKTSVVYIHQKIMMRWGTKTRFTPTVIPNISVEGLAEITIMPTGEIG